MFGLAHWHSRNVSPRFPAYERKSDGEDEDSPFWKWDERARGLMKFEAFEPLPELMARKTIGEFGMEQHIQCWYFVDYLMAAKKGPTMQLLHELKAPFHQQHKLPTHAELLARQEAAVRRAFGQNVVELEGAWREYARTARRKK